MDIRLVHGGAYNSDIRNLRSAIRATGSNATHEWVTVSHPTATNNRLDVLVNLAFQPNKHHGKVDGSLYILGFRNSTGTYHFHPFPVPANPPAGSIAINAKGTYGSLGWAF